MTTNNQRNHTETMAKGMYTAYVKSKSPAALLGTA